MKILNDGNYLATLRDADNQILSSGEARFYSSEFRGVFWPQEQADEDLLLTKTASVQTSEGHILAIRKIARCQAGFPPVVHYDFDFEALD